MSSNPSITIVHFPIYTLCGLYKIQYGRFTQVKCVVQEIWLFFEPVTNSLVVPVNSEGSLLALIKFSKFIFSPGIEVMLVEVIILFVCQLVIFLYQWEVAVLHLLSIVFCHLFFITWPHIALFVDSNSWSVRRTTLYNTLPLPRWEDMKFFSSSVKIRGDSLSFFERAYFHLCAMKVRNVRLWHKSQHWEYLRRLS